MHQYVIVDFDEGMAVIREDWAIYKDEKIVASYYPDRATSNQRNKLLRTEISHFDTEMWCDTNGLPYIVKKIFGTAGKYMFISLHTNIP